MEHACVGGIAASRTHGRYRATCRLCGCCGGLRAFKSRGDGVGTILQPKDEASSYYPAESGGTMMRQAQLPEHGSELLCSGMGEEGDAAPGREPDSPPREAEVF